MCFSHEFSHGLFNLLVSETVDEWVQHGNHHCVKHRHHFVLICGVAGLGHHINEGNGPKEQSDCSEVRGAGGEGLLAAFSRAHPQY